MGTSSYYRTMPSLKLRMFLLACRSASLASLKVIWRVSFSSIDTIESPSLRPTRCAFEASLTYKREQRKCRSEETRHTSSTCMKNCYRHFKVHPAGDFQPQRLFDIILGGIRFLFLHRRRCFDRGMHVNCYWRHKLHLFTNNRLFRHRL